MRKTCGCPTVPNYLYMVRQLFGATQLLTEPGKTVQGWIDSFDGQDARLKAPPLWYSLRAAVLHQRRRSAQPKVHKINTFAVVALPLSLSQQARLEACMTEQVAYNPSGDTPQEGALLDVFRDPPSKNYLLSAEGLERLKQMLVDPKSAGLSMQLFTAERAEEIYMTGWEGDFVG